MNLQDRAPRRRGPLGALLLAVALLAIAVGAASAQADAGFENFDFESVAASLSSTQAGAHPDFVTTFTLNGDPSHADYVGQGLTWGKLRDVATELPPGLIGNPNAFPTCSTARLMQYNVQEPATWSPCPADSQVGLLSPGLWELFPPGSFREPLYLLPSPGGDVVARFGTAAVFFPILIDVRVDPQRENAVTATVISSPAAAAPVTGASATIWGVPTDPSHDGERFDLGEALSCEGPCEPHSSGLAPTAFFSNPTSCGPGEVGFSANNYQLPERFVHATAPLPAITGCESLSFDPTMSLQPTSRHTAAPSGIDVSLSVPQENITNPNSLRTSDLRNAVVTLPKGVSLNASAADGLAGCSESQVGLTSTSPIRFDAAEANCPNGSKLGTVKITTPVLADPLEGSLYVAKQGENPFKSLLAGYIVAKGKGVVIKQAARFELDPSTGQIKAIVENAPQQPFSNLEMHLKGGARGVLQTPSACGTYSSTYELTPWSGSAPLTGVSSFTIDEGCATGGFAPKLSAGSTSPIAGDYAPFVFDVSRQDGEQNLAALDVTLPEGLTAKLAGVGLCADAQAATGACPAASQIGSVHAAVGVGSLPLWAPQPGKSPTAVYLAGPYKGAPYSILAKVPAQAGPFDLGVVSVRSGLYVDPITAQATVKSDPLPQILQGIPITYREVQVDADRPQFALNPTNCDPMSVNAAIHSAQGAIARPSDRFQVGSCGDLGFKPRLSLSLKGGTHRSDHPALRAVLRPRAGDANARRASVALPHSEFLDQAHIGTVCTRVQFAAGGGNGEQCPAASIYGHASALSPILSEPLAGPVFLRSSDNPLPDLVLALHGQVDFDAVGRIDSVKGGIRSTFDFIPDAPITKVVLSMQGGKKGLLVNSTSLCAKRNRAAVRFDAQNGKTADFNPVVSVKCGKAPKRGRSGARAAR